jgi:hypothetical protein
MASKKNPKKNKTSKIPTQHVEVVQQPQPTTPAPLNDASRKQEIINTTVKIVSGFGDMINT